jgi:hypothetical protein
MKRTQPQIPRRAHALARDDKNHWRCRVIASKNVVESDGTLFGMVRRFLALIRETLHEIFDEAAYSRYLTRHSAESSVDAYHAFLREGEHELERKPRCC